MKKYALIWLLLPVLSAGGCRQPNAQPAADVAELRAAVQRHTETLMRIHFKLDDALKAVSSAEDKSREGDCSTAGYHSAEAYRALQEADEQLLDFGKELQQLFKLDAASANDR